ncbi:MAG: YfhO family protein [Erysipelotrichales bacterium]|nr:YfhO family protein [Erysipelotrichales bacterium]
MKRKLLLIYAYILSFLCPALIFLFALKTNGIYPFGDSTLLFVDSQGQYISFLNYYRSILLGANNIKYTFAKPLGGDMVSMFTYYLLSPFNLLYVFFDMSSLPLGIAIVTILKIGTIGISMYILLRHLNKDKIFSSLIFSTAYALCSYVIVYNFNFMFLDGVIFAPLIILGISKIFEGKRNIFYVISLALAILINYYIGFMLCFFAGVFFLYKYYEVERNKDETKKLFQTFIIGSILAGAISSFSWVSAVLNMSGAKASLENSSAFSMQTLWKIADFSKNLTSKSYLGMDDIINGAPLMFIGVVSLILCALYFMNNKFSIRERICSATVIVLFVFIMLFTFPNNLLHGGSAPTWFTFRYAFVFDFFLIYLAFKEFNNLEGLKIHHYVIPLFILALISVILKLNGIETNVLQDILIAVVTLVLIMALKYFKHKLVTGAVSVLLVLINSLNLNVNTNHVISTNKEASENGSGSYISYEKYNKETSEIGKVIDFVKDYDESDEFYRMEKTFYSQATYNLANNDSFMFDYAGLTHYSSSDKLSTRNYLAYYMGFHTNYNWASYGLGSTLTANSLMGIKYIIDRDYEYNSILIPNRHFGARNYLTPIKDFDSYLGDQIHVFENPYALSLAYLSKLPNNEQSEEKHNVFRYQNQMLKNLTGLDLGDVFKPLEFTFTYQNIEPLEQENHYVLIDLTKPGYINYAVKLDNELKKYPMYYYIKDGFSQYMSLTDTRNLYYFHMYNYAVNPIEYSPYQSTKNYQLKLNENLYWDNVEIIPSFYYEDVDLLKLYIAELQKNNVSLKRLSSSHLKGTVTYNEDNPLLMTSIPFEGKWKLKVNNKPVKTFITQNLFVSADLSKLSIHNGDSITIDLEYVTNEYTLTIILGLIAIGYIFFIDYNYGKKIISKLKTK